MNAGPADTHSPHLDLADLIAEAAGQPVSARASEHLARCEQCRAEADSWNLVADGVRGVTAAAPETARPAHPHPAPYRHRRPRVLTRPVRRTLLAVGAASAAAVLIGVAGHAAGFVQFHFGGTPGTSGSTALTAVGGCTPLEEASGTLEQVNGSSLVIETPGGQPVTLTTTASTFAGMSGALLSDIRDGAPVRVTGPSSDGTIAALLVTTSLHGSLPETHPSVPGAITVDGTAADVTSSGFTVLTSGGTRVPVTTSGYTTVTVFNVSLSQLQPGALIAAVGFAGPQGTLSARAVMQPGVGVVQPPPGVPGAKVGASMSVSGSSTGHGCSPTSLALAMGTAGYGG
jgi:hypothetical protein